MSIIDEKKHRIINVNEDKCNNCHACVSVCPVKNCISAVGDVVSTVDERCVACGRCLHVCTQAARSYSDDTERFFDDVTAGVNTVILFAPSVVSAFPQIEKLAGFFRSKGARAVFDVSFGAELYVHSVLHAGEKNKTPVSINSSCPVIVSYCSIYKPELLPYLAPVHTPILHTAIMIREFFPQFANCRLAAVTPCAAKKREFEETGYVEYNITLTMLRKYFTDQKINIDDFEDTPLDGPQAERGVAFSSPGKMNEILLRENPRIGSLRSVHGETAYRYLNDLEAILAEGIAPRFIDCLNCSRGCTGGPATETRSMPIDKIEYHVLKREEKHKLKYGAEIKNEVEKYWNEDLYKRSFNDLSDCIKDIQIPNEKELKQIFKEMGKMTDADILNCAACGYGSCEGMAKAVFNKLNKAENCSYYLKLKAEAASKTKTNFLATMSHEIRTPLNSIIGLTEIELQKPGMQGGAKEALEKILVSGGSLLGIINDILDISKIETGKFELIYEPYDLASLINDAVQLNILRANDKPISFKLSIAERVPRTFIGDELRVRQILNNLLSNAFKYTRRGNVELAVDFTGRDTLVFSVTDTGIGIKKADLNKLFDEYSQLDTKANRMIEGTGLGLAITKKLAEMMSGKITVESEYGIGSSFTVKLKQTAKSKAYLDKKTITNLKDFTFTSKRVRSIDNIQRIQMPYGRVLVIDDVQTNLDVARGLILPYGIKVYTATSGVEAIHMIREQQIVFDALFIDYMMPVMDGLTTGSIIKNEINTDYARNLPLIALTADAIAGNKEKFLAAGFADFITKPISAVKLDEVLRKYVYNKEREEAIFGKTAPCRVKRESAAAEEYIEGINYRAALGRFGSETVLLDIVKSYVKNTPPLLIKTAKITKETLAEYAVIVHGIRGASCAIGAEAAGEKAEELEIAAREQRLEFCAAENIVFQKQINKLIENLSAFIARRDIAVVKPRKEKPEAELLERLKAACAAYRMNEADSIMERLESFSYDEDNDIITRVREHLNNSDFASIKALL
ncbi:MAG: response regulator [Spirochaetaceae bacterium]|jgi:signal transduction histidine kinase/CheY-like chemotaxis protein/iron only hydrogenase large subunit-like protein|nr:response regulator [Spirochaetaceae bacterium]